ncbi:MAG: HEAT repeat domain-containing protein [Planctomycetota bacterium]
MKNGLTISVALGALILAAAVLPAETPSGDSALSRLVAVAQSGSDTFARRGAIQDLGAIGSSESVSALKQLISLEEAELRLTVAQALDRSRNLEAIDGLVSLSKDGDPRVADRAIAGLKVIFLTSDRDAIPYMADALQNAQDADRARIEIIRAFAKTTTDMDRAESAIIKVCESAYDEVATEAYKTLGEIGGIQTVSFLTEKISDDFSRNLDDMIRCANRIMARSQASVSSPDFNPAASRLPAYDSDAMAGLAVAVAELLYDVEVEALPGVIAVLKAGKRYEGLPALIMLLREERSVARETLDALQSITGQKIIADADAWQIWMQKEVNENEDFKTVIGWDENSVKAAVAPVAPVASTGSRTTVYIIVFAGIVGCIAFLVLAHRKNKAKAIKRYQTQAFKQRGFKTART